MALNSLYNGEDFCKKGEYYCNTDKVPTYPEGYTVREDGFLVKEGIVKYKKSIDCNNPKGFSQKALLGKEEND